MAYVEARKQMEIRKRKESSEHTQKDENSD